MKVRIVLLASFLLLCVQISWTESIKLILQNGLNGYNGCEDSYVTERSSSLNYGNSDTLLAYYEKCVS